MKSLLSNIMMHGLDAEHQRGLMSGDASVQEGDEETEDDDEKHSKSPSAEMNKIKIDGWENLEEYPDVEVIQELDQEVLEEEQGMRAHKRLPHRSGENSIRASRRNSGAGVGDGDDDASVGSSRSNDSWNKLTKVEEIVNRRSIVCVPSDLLAPPVRLRLLIVPMSKGGMVYADSLPFWSAVLSLF